MGNIAFDIFTSVDLNQIVEPNMSENVFIKVDNPEQLATVEADAEDFGPLALAEFEAYTLVRQASVNNSADFIPNPGMVDPLAHILDFGLEPEGFSGFDSQADEGINEPDRLATRLADDRYVYSEK